MPAPQRIMIATPATGGMVTAAFTGSILRIVQTFHAQRPEVGFTLRMTVGSDLSVMRNFLAAAFLADATLTHLLFIDADTAVTPNLVAKYLDFDKPFVGSLYPFRSLDTGRLRAALPLAEDDAEAASVALDYVAADELIPLSDAEPAFQVTRGFARARRIGTGAMMITKQVLRTLRDTCPHLDLPAGAPAYRALGHDGPVLQCFAPLQSADGSFFSEDMSFCERWTQAGGEIWACVDEVITHVGPHAFTGRYLDRLKRGLFQTE